METMLICSTPHYHKLIEYAARRCYDRFTKCGFESHMLVRNIMRNIHLSIANYENVVTTTNSVDRDNYHDILALMVVFKGINNYIRWARDSKSKWEFVESLSIIIFINIVYKGVDTPLFKAFTKSVLCVPSLRWFEDKDYQIEGSENHYLQSDTDLLQPTVLSSDYIALKGLGLTDYELELYTMITVEIVSDRAMSLQDARHTDMMGRSEISQRYVKMSDYKYRVSVGLDETDVIYSEANGLIKVAYIYIMGTITTRMTN